MSAGAVVSFAVTLVLCAGVSATSASERWQARVREGAAAYEAGKFGAAEAAFQAAMAEIAAAPADSRVVETLSWLGQAVQQQGRLEAAEALYRRALATAEGLYGSADVKVLGAVNRLAQFCFGRRRYDEARALYQRALVIVSTTAGLDARLADTFLGRLAEIGLFQGDYADAELGFRRRLADQDRRGDATSLRRMEALLGLAWTLEAQGRRPDAAATRQQAAGLLDRRGAEWEPTLRDSLRAPSMDLTRGHPSRGLLLHLLAAVVEARDGFAEASSYHEQGVALLEDAGLGATGWGAAWLEEYARLLRRRGLDSAAREALARAAAVRAQPGRR